MRVPTSVGGGILMIRQGFPPLVELLLPLLAVAGFPPRPKSQLLPQPPADRKVRYLLLCRARAPLVTLFQALPRDPAVGTLAQGLRVRPLSLYRRTSRRLSSSENQRPLRRPLPDSILSHPHLIGNNNGRPVHTDPSVVLRSVVVVRPQRHTTTHALRRARGPVWALQHPNHCRRRRPLQVSWPS